MVRVLRLGKCEIYQTLMLCPLARELTLPFSWPASHRSTRYNHEMISPRPRSSPPRALALPCQPRFGGGGFAIHTHPALHSTHTHTGLKPTLPILLLGKLWSTYLRKLLSQLGFATLCLRPAFISNGFLHTPAAHISSSHCSDCCSSMSR